MTLCSSQPVETIWKEHILQNGDARQFLPISLYKRFLRGGGSFSCIFTPQWHLKSTQILTFMKELMAKFLKNLFHSFLKNSYLI